ncbi:MAG: hypothetical protein JJLCMIEE_00791 [Acidimicrobiales bacterium]|nr:MAG: DUF559 domain-containing protein [Actinomycetota bacterium]MBV6507735.1 hypothetical protein [Acidimicrobiales bacterium]RIK07659.1 MAG: hypothetical protein DCC48_03985 [Acidobacteriota bacterium]
MSLGDGWMAGMAGYTEKLDEMARGNHGLLTREALLRLGMRGSSVDRWVRQGRLHQLHAGVYRTAGAPVTRHQSLMAACLAAGDDAVVSHRAAASLWGLVDLDPPIEIAMPRPRGPRLAGVVMHRSLDLKPSHLTLRFGIPVTNPLRTLLDLGATVPLWILESAVDRALIRKLATIDGLQAILQECAKKGRRGCGTLRMVIEDRPLQIVEPKSELETLMARVLRDHGGPALEYQYEVELAGKKRFLDFAEPSVQLGIEIDSMAFHASRADMEADHARQNALHAAGWLIMRYSLGDLRNRPGQVCSEIRQLIKARSREHPGTVA